jgi:diazepam-binding inhibitor (GABA receptor modulator, acyl-CoA-binding protein)
MEEEFRAALNYIKDTTNPPLDTSNEQKLDFYALFKQATEGPPKGSPPSRLRVVERAKFMAWKARQSLTKDQAMQEYVNLMTKLAPNWKKPKL